MALNLAGKIVRLRALEEGDLAPLAASYNDLDMQLTTDGDAPPMSDIQVKAFWGEIITNAEPNLRYFAIEPLTGQTNAGKMVGACSLQNIDLRNRHAELSIFMLSREYRGLGYGTDAVRLLLVYAFDVLRLDKVYLGVYDFNEGGIRTYERVGFRYEGCLRQMLHYEGRYWDEWHMSILRSEWEAGQRAPADGLRPYHPDDLEAALALIQALAKEPVIREKETARVFLRRWWHQFDRALYGYQLEGKLVGLLTIDSEGFARDMLVEPDQQTALQDTLGGLS